MSNDLDLNTKKIIDSTGASASILAIMMLSMLAIDTFSNVSKGVHFAIGVVAIVIALLDGVGAHLRTGHSQYSGWSSANATWALVCIWLFVGVGEFITVGST